MKPIIVIDLPLGMGIDRKITEPYGYDLFYGDENIEAQWKKLEELRETGGVIVVQPSNNSVRFARFLILILVRMDLSRNVVYERFTQKNMVISVLSFITTHQRLWLLEHFIIIVKRNSL